MEKDEILKNYMKRFRPREKKWDPATIEFIVNLVSEGGSYRDSIDRFLQEHPGTSMLFQVIRFHSHKLSNTQGLLLHARLLWDDG